MSQAEPTLHPTAVPRATTGAVPPWLLVVAAILSTQIGAAVAKQLFETVGTSGVVFLRTFIGGLLFAVLWRPRVRGYRRQDYLTLALYGVVISGMMLTFYAAIARIPLAITVAIAFTGPLGVAVAGSRRLRDLIWVIMAIIGVLLLSPITNTTLDPLGLFLAVLSALGWVAFIVISPRVARTFDQNTGLTIGMCIAAVVSLPFGLAGASRVLADPALIVMSIVIAILASAIPFAFEFQALARLPGRVYSLLTSLEPVVATIIGFVALHEALELREIAGILLVTIAAVATTLSLPQPTSDHEKRHAPPAVDRGS
jgi:inner membrane transporter RhtA